MRMMASFFLFCFGEVFSRKGILGKLQLTDTLAVDRGEVKGKKLMILSVLSLFTF